MIQFNLLPDIKLEYIRAKRAKRTVLLVASIVSGIAVAVFVFLFLTVNVFQKQHIEDLTADIEEQVAVLDDTPNLDEILTIQNQLNSLTPLHEEKPVATRLATYLPQLVPQMASISELNINFSESTMKFDGSADSLVTVNKFADTLKFTQYSLGEDKVDAFSEVVMSDFSRSSEEVSYTITLKFDPNIFDSANEVTLTVPQIISTRSQTEKPSENLFKEQAAPQEGVQQ